jgi:mannosyl-oligosaccharide glucosidase
MTTVSHILYISLEIIKSWVSLIDENGWVAREQILGAEARSKVFMLWK